MTPASVGHGLPGFAFIAEPLDRADHLRTDEIALAVLRTHGRCIGVDGEGRTAVDAQDGLQMLSGELADDAVFLGMQGDQPWFARLIAQWPEGQRTLDLRAAVMQWPAFESTLFAQARAVLRWRSQYRHCPVCAHALTFSRAGWQGNCEACGAVQYPRSDPAVIVAVSDGERLLLGRQSTWTPKMRYSTLAGFVEPGESLEEAVARELFEEAGIRVSDVSYVASQPWPFPSSLMIGCRAVAHDPALTLDETEIEAAMWVDRAEVRAALAGDMGAPFMAPPPMAIARYLLEDWAK